MTRRTSARRYTRRDLFRLGGGTAAALAGAALAARSGALLQPARVSASSLQQSGPPPNVHFIGSDGWISLPESANAAPYHPDDAAPEPFNTYMFGFRDVTGLSDGEVQQRRGWIQAPAPMLFFDQNQEYYLKLTNLGLTMRPDLIDAHTLHWHGFRNAIPMFDGEPFSSISVPIGKSLTYYYLPRDPGTYMYHCHVEDTEHVHMGMTGVVAVRPSGQPKWAYNDASSAFDREYTMLLTEVWSQMHWNNSHVQATEWTDYQADYFLLNGRCYPDTLEPPTSPEDENAGRLRYQPYSSLVRANSGERVLLRFVNLGFMVQTMTLAGIKMRVIAKDATLLRGRTGADGSYLTNNIVLGPGESIDAIFEAPPVTSESTYLLYNRNFARLHNGGDAGRGGQMTEVRIAPAGVPAQTTPNT